MLISLKKYGSGPAPVFSTIMAECQQSEGLVFSHELLLSSQEVPNPNSQGRKDIKNNHFMERLKRKKKIYSYRLDSHITLNSKTQWVYALLIHENEVNPK